MKISKYCVKHSLLLALLTLYSVKASGQMMPDMQNSFNKYQKQALTEKLFVHTDKNFYLAGEIMWFKIYDVDGNTKLPLSISKVAYVEVLNNDQSPILQAKISLDAGSGNGSLFLPVTLSNGNYSLRAYTAWMKNFSPDFYFEKPVTIVNTLKAPDAPVQTSQPEYDVQFFPEGGNMVAGLSSNIAFKAVGPDGKGITCTGAIINQRNDTITHFHSAKFGMGHFIFTPVSGNIYRAVVNTGSHKPVITNLPIVVENGYTMQVSNLENGRMTVSVNSNKQDEPVYLMVHTRQDINVVEGSSIINGKAHFEIDKSKLGEGVSHLTIFNSSRQPVCERLYFKKPKPQLFITATTNQQEYGLRRKVNINVATADANKHAVNTNMSVSVYRIDTLTRADYSSINEYLWLQSEIKGYIESPDYYFSTDTGANSAADNLMLTQGWSRFKWSNVLDNRPPAFNYLPEYEGHIITAKLTSTSNLPVKDAIAYISVPGKRIQFYAAGSDSTGRLLFNTKNFYGPNELVAQTNFENDSTYHLDVLSPFSEQYSSSRLPAFRINNNDLSLLKKYNLELQVQNIYAGKSFRHFNNPVTDSSAYFGPPDKIYKLDDYTRFTTIEEVLREYVGDISVTRRRNKFHVQALGQNGFLSEDDMLVLLDGVPIFNLNQAFALDPLKIRKLDLVRDVYFWGPDREAGILSFTTYKGDLGGYEIDPRAVVLDYEGMQFQREFYSPVYGTDEQQHSHVPDYRTLLYWSPSLNTNQLGKGEFSFYTSDRAGKYIGVIQGITAEGKAASHYFTFQVK